MLWYVKYFDSTKLALQKYIKPVEENVFYILGKKIGNIT